MKQVKQVNELTTDELRRLLKLREEQDAILLVSLGPEDETVTTDILFHSYPKKYRKKPHWTQTPAGKRKMTAAINKSWAERKARQAQGGSNTP